MKQLARSPPNSRKLLGKITFTRHKNGVGRSNCVVYERCVASNLACQREFWYKLWQSGYADQRDKQNSRSWSWQCWSRGHHWSFRKSLQPLSNEELYDLAQQLSEEQKEYEDDRGTKEMQTKDLTIFFPLQIWQLKSYVSYVISILTGNAAVQ